jgi:hypothetical protein
MFSLSSLLFCCISAEELAFTDTETVVTTLPEFRAIEAAVLRPLLGRPLPAPVPVPPCQALCAPVLQAVPSCVYAAVLDATALSSVTASEGHHPQRSLPPIQVSRWSDAVVLDKLKPHAVPFVQVSIVSWYPNSGLHFCCVAVKVE